MARKITMYYHLQAGLTSTGQRIFDHSDSKRVRNPFLSMTSDSERMKL